MEKADRLTGRRIQAVMREGSQDGGGVGERTRGRWGSRDGSSYLKIFCQNHQPPWPGGERQVKVQGSAMAKARGEEGEVINTDSELGGGSESPNFGLSPRGPWTPDYLAGASASPSKSPGHTGTQAGS